MSLRALALDWRIDGPDATAFLVLVAATGTLYLLAAARGNSRDRRGRRWLRGRSLCFMAGLACWWSTCTPESGRRPTSGFQRTCSSTW
jgi:hypothetical protein